MRLTAGLYWNLQEQPEARRSSKGVASMTQFGRNERKRQVLGILERAGPLTMPELAVRARIYPIAAGYARLRSMVRWGLLRRTRRRGLFVYSLTEKGRERLRWLERIARPPSEATPQTSLV